MRTTVPFLTDIALPLRIDIRVILIMVSSILFFVNLANANNDNNPSLGLIGEKSGKDVVIKLDAISAADYEILIDGKPYSGDFQSNQNKTIHVYNLSELRNKAFFVHEFDVDGNKITGKFNTVLEFLSHLNANSDSIWSWDEKRGILYGGNELNTYKGIMVTKAGEAGRMVKFPSASLEIPKNLVISIPEGEHTITVNHFLTGYSETKDFTVSTQIAKK